MTPVDMILLAHGAGGKLSRRLIEEDILTRFESPLLRRLDDGATLTFGNLKLAYSTDSFVVDPIFFRGGDIGKLAINGTVNDIAMCGAVPMYLTTSLIIEEGFKLQDLRRILNSMRDAADEANVEVVAGDTKVVSVGNADKIFINTSGIGIVEKEVSGSNAKTGDKVIISGFIGDHGIAILSEREGLDLKVPVTSDCSPLNGLVSSILDVADGVHALRDPTRGGLATALNEIALQSDVGIRIYEEMIPVRDAVRGACEMLGLDPLYVANEGKMVTIVSQDDAPRVLEIMREHRNGSDARMIGEVIAEPRGTVLMRTRIGGERIVDMLTGEQLPRIC
ncbi:hydrogenase expression/formation protein HypE [bacterium]|nr:MAG: hydrogenase expression/formation protein HypE [bacterium]